MNIFYDLYSVAPHAGVRSFNKNCNIEHESEICAVIKLLGVHQHQRETFCSSRWLAYIGRRNKRTMLLPIKMPMERMFPKRFFYLTITTWLQDI